MWCLKLTGLDVFYCNIVSFDGILKFVTKQILDQNSGSVWHEYGAGERKLGVSFDISPNGFHINIIFSTLTNCLFSEVSHLESGLSLSRKIFFGDLWDI